MSNAIFEVRGIRKKYTLGGQTLKILNGVDFSIDQGAMVGIVGASGAGKSTLLHIMGLLDRPDEGQILFDNEPVNFRARKKNAELRSKSLGFVFQFYHLLPELTALENVVLNPMMDSGVFSWWGARKEASERAADLLKSLGLGERLKHKPNQLSGGERQRVAIARALLSNPKVLFCDEPTGNLDEKTSDTIVDLLFEINANRKQTMVIVTHNEALADRMPRLERLTEGVLKEVPTSAAV